MGVIRVMTIWWDCLFLAPVLGNRRLDQNKSTLREYEISNEVPNSSIMSVPLSINDVSGQRKPCLADPAAYPILSFSALLTHFSFLRFSCASRA
jgi:hypothetical protein